MCQQNLSDTPVLSDFSKFTIFVPLIMKNVFEKVALYCRRGANTLLFSE